MISQSDGKQLHHSIGGQVPWSLKVTSAQFWVLNIHLPIKRAYDSLEILEQGK